MDRLPSKLHEKVYDIGLSRYLSIDSAEAPQFLADLVTYSEAMLSILVDRAADAHVVSCCEKGEYPNQPVCVIEGWTPEECGTLMVASIVVECGPSA